MMRKSDVTFTLAGIRRGALSTLAMSPGLLAYGAGFGLLATQAGLSLLQALAMSGLVYSGSAQLASVGILSARPPTLAATMATLAATILVINARYLLYGATLRPWLAPLSPFRAYSTLFFVGDAAWLVSMRAYEAGERDAGFVLGANACSWLPWLAGTVIGAWATGFAPDPRRLGLDFFLVAFAAAMMLGMVRARRDLAVALIAAAVAIIVERFANFGAAIIAAGIAGGLLAWLRAVRPEAGA